eukprot:1156265-Pelagomonas_calceolata.AAC.3
MLEQCRQPVRNDHVRHCVLYINRHDSFPFLPSPTVQEHGVAQFLHPARSVGLPFKSQCFCTVVCIPEVVEVDDTTRSRVQAGGARLQERHMVVPVYLRAGQHAFVVPTHSIRL